MVYFRRSRTLIFYRKLPGNWGVVARKSSSSEWVKIKLVNEYVVRNVDHGKNVNNKGRIDTVPSNA